MPKPIGLQLYTVRAALAEDFAGTIEQIAEIGYAAVETAGFPGTTAQEAADLFKQLGLEVAGAHSPMPLGDKQNEVLETLEALGAKYLVCPHIPPDSFQTYHSIASICDQLNEASAIARSRGITMVYHNHWWEYTPVGDMLPYRAMLDFLDPAVKLELDAYWAQVGGCDPIAVLEELGERVTLLHVKDGSALRDDPQLAVGGGVLDYTTIIPAARYADYMIVELDRCATDMMEAVEKSYTYLTEKGLAHGR
jgi:sugar phosphate isomerase/epimerase